MDLTFQVPMQYCSLQDWTLLISPVTSTTGCCFCFGSIPSFFLELFFYWFPVAFWAPTDSGSSPFSILSFCLFMLFMGFSRQEYWSGLPFPSPVDHILSESINSYSLNSYKRKETGKGRAPFFKRISWSFVFADEDSDLPGTSKTAEKLRRGRRRRKCFHACDWKHSPVSHWSVMYMHYFWVGQPSLLQEAI